MQQHFEKVQMIANPHNRLYTVAANQGLAAARGRHLLLLNPDTFPRPGSFARLIEYAESNPEVGLVGPRILDADGRDDRLTGRNYPTPWSEFSDWMGFTRLFPTKPFLKANLRPRYDRSLTAPAPLLSGACLLLSERLPADLRCLNADYRMYGEDLDLSRRVQAAGFTTVLLAEAVIIHLGGQSSQQAQGETALLAIDAANRYFRQWHGPDAARRHRLLMAVVALVKGVAFSLLHATDLRADAAEKRHFYKTLLRWSWHGGFSEPPTPQLRTSPHLE